jgi:hypothetical protein
VERELVGWGREEEVEVMVGWGREEEVEVMVGRGREVLVGFGVEVGDGVLTGPPAPALGANPRRGAASKTTN